MLTSRSARQSLLMMALLPAGAAWAQQAPDAGRLLQQQQATPQIPSRDPALTLPTPDSPAAPAQGLRVSVNQISIEGATLFSEGELLALLGDYAGQSYDLAGMRQLAGRIRAHYVAAGYPFTRALIPEQAMADGRLRISVIEARYGDIQVTGDADLIEPTRAYLSDLKTGDPISAPGLERPVLLLRDLPGIQAVSNIRKGADASQGDLLVEVKRGEAISGNIGLDNAGDRFTGEHRLYATLNWNSPLMLGDRLTAGALYAGEGLWLGNLAYSMPISHQGLRTDIAYAENAYQLGKDFAALGASGTAKVTSIGLEYPFIRSSVGNLRLLARLQHKRLNDRSTLGRTDNQKSSASLPLTLAFDRISGGGVTYGSLTYTTGHLRLDSVLENTDTLSGMDTRGKFDYWKLDMARLQYTPVQHLKLFGRVAAQWAGKNLDSSEGFTLGGSNSVRAYPTSEGAGDEGWLLQLEARYALDKYEPYLFHDSGRSILNADNGSLTAPANRNYRSISGTGVGIRYRDQGFSVDANMSWRGHGGDPLADKADRSPRVWVTINQQF